MDVQVPIDQGKLLEKLKDRFLAAKKGEKEHVKRAAEYAISQGLILQEMKELLEHGKFFPYIEEHLKCSDRQARRYMELARQKPKTDTVAEFAIRITGEALYRRYQRKNLRMGEVQPDDDETSPPDLTQGIKNAISPLENFLKVYSANAANLTLEQRKAVRDTWMTFQRAATEKFDLFSNLSAHSDE